MIQVLQNKSEIFHNILKNILWEEIWIEEEDPSKLSDIDKIPQLLSQIIESKKNIYVAGDFDADGICATTILVTGLRYLFRDKDIQIFFWTPERQDGHWLNDETFKYAIDNNCGILFSVDNGSNDRKIIQKYKDQIEVVITDHHPIQEEVIDYYLINPLRGYPDPYICGSGVAYKIVRYLEKYYREEFPIDILHKIKALLVLATSADMVPLRKENLFYLLNYRESFNLKNLSKSSPFLSQLIKENKIDINSGKFLGFWLGPLFNGAGRLNRSNYLIQILVKENIYSKEELDKHVKYLWKLNVYRKELTQQWLDYVNHKNLKKTRKNIVCISGIDIPSGVKRLIANSFLNETITFSLCGSLSGTSIAASVTNNTGLDILSFLQGKKYVNKIGWHRNAFGFSYKAGMEIQMLDELQEYIDQTIVEKEEQLVYTLDTYSLEEIRTLAQDISGFVWGTELPEPRFQSTLEIQSQFILKDKHLKIIATTLKGDKVQVLFWNRTKKYMDKKISIVHTIDINSYDNTIQFIGVL